MFRSFVTFPVNSNFVAAGHKIEEKAIFSLIKLYIFFLSLYCSFKCIYFLLTFLYEKIDPEKEQCD